ncbi:sterol desaturase family protein [Microbulbifer sp. VAAC004]|uniref:sterol desaturase family protein n=1 Tax=unclassified Microbulbifer TaxID=2619833 RepID=UPI004039E010
MSINHDAAPFRAGYRARVKGRYHGWLHLMGILAIGAGVCIYCMFQLDLLKTWELLVIPAGTVIYNFSEYASHRWAGHKKIRIAGLFYRRHTGDHHSFFSPPLFSIDSTRDWRIVLFPTYLTATLALVIAPILGYFFSILFSMNAGYLLIVTMVVNHLGYELLHLGYHQPQNHWFHRVPVLRELAQLHRIHHQRKWMNECNFNLTIPLFDLLLGTFHWKSIGSCQKNES